MFTNVSHWYVRVLDCKKKEISDLCAKKLWQFLLQYLGQMSMNRCLIEALEIFTYLQHVQVVASCCAKLQ
jgi:hypothetical protein